VPAPTSTVHSERTLPPGPASETYTLKDDRAPAGDEFRDLDRRESKVGKTRKRPRKRRIERAGGDVDLHKYFFYGVIALGVLLFISGWWSLAAVYVMLVLGMLFFMIGELWCTIIAFQDGVSEGLMYVFWPYYRITWVIANFGTCGVGAILMLGGFAYEVVALLTLVMKLWHK
jgi:hypothetical protein